MRWKLFVSYSKFCRRYWYVNEKRCYSALSDVLPKHEEFSNRHIGPNKLQQQQMLEKIGVAVSDCLIVNKLCFADILLKIAITCFMKCFFAKLYCLFALCSQHECKFAIILTTVLLIHAMCVLEMAVNLDPLTERYLCKQ